MANAGIRQEYIVERQGRSFVLYQGLLDLAHQQGLKSILTDVVQLGCEENGQTWLFKATVMTDRGTFTGFGDASPAIVSRAMQNCLPRFAETRAKARALRDAVNVGVAALEELDGDDSSHSAPSQPKPAAVNPPPERQAPQPQQQQQAAPVQQQRSATGGVPATDAQIRAIFSIGGQVRHLSEDQVIEQCQGTFGKEPHQLTKVEASQFITSLKGNQG